MKITATVPMRIDLAGGTLDVYPLYMFEVAANLSAAIDAQRRTIETGMTPAFDQCRTGLREEHASLMNPLDKGCLALGERAQAPPTGITSKDDRPRDGLGHLALHGPATRLSPERSPASELAQSDLAPTWSPGDRIPRASRTIFRHWARLGALVRGGRLAPGKAFGRPRPRLLAQPACGRQLYQHPARFGGHQLGDAEALY